jgi:toxin ParE1/3/4
LPARRRAVLLSPKAESDLEDIWLYTRDHWSPAQAYAYIDAIGDAFDDLATGRKIGRPVGVRDGYLKYAVGSHLAFYRMNDKELVVVRILHQRMDVELHLPN